MTNHLSNNAPRDADDFADDLKEIQYALSKWKETELDDAATQELHQDIERAAKLKKEADASHKEYKEPHLKAGRKVDDNFRPVRDGFSDAHKEMKKILGAYMAEQQRIQEEVARKAREEAERKAAEAREAENAFLADEKEAEQAALKAKRAERQAEAAGYSKAGDGRAISLRTYYIPETVDVAALVAHYADHPDVIAAAEKVAAGVVRSTKGQAVIPGIKVKEEKRAA